MLNIQETLKQAHSFFVAKQYDKALFLYSQISALDANNKEYKLYALLCDIASENDEKGQSLFDYFTIAKEEQAEDAINYVLNLINSQDGDNDRLMSLLNELSTQTIEALDAIAYEDFKTLIEQRGSFRVAYEDIMFSTKVAITNKEDFYDFVNQLIDNGFYNTAYTYLDGFNEYFKYDIQIMELYNKLESCQVDSETK